MGFFPLFKCMHVKKGQVHFFFNNYLFNYYYYYGMLERDSTISTLVWYCPLWIKPIHGFCSWISPKVLLPVEVLSLHYKSMIFSILNWCGTFVCTLTIIIIIRIDVKLNEDIFTYILLSFYLNNNCIALYYLSSNLHHYSKVNIINQ